MAELDDDPIAWLDLIDDSSKAPLARVASCTAAGDGRVRHGQPCPGERVAQIFAPALDARAITLCGHGAVAAKMDYS